jgi:hypothetical protein
VMHRLLMKHGKPEFIRSDNGGEFVAQHRLPTSTEFNLTVPGQDMEAAIESETFSPEDERVTYRNDADMTLNHRKSRL